jgi:hypothetical protein
LGRVSSAVYCRTTGVRREGSRTTDATELLRLERSAAVWQRARSAVGSALGDDHRGTADDGSPRSDDELDEELRRLLTG